MKSIQEIKKDQENQVSELFKACRVFFAFSNQQFAENKTPLAEGDKYVSMGAGGYLPKSEVDNYLKGMDKIEADYKKAVKENKGARRADIVYELANHESYYTNCIDSAMEALGKGYTRKEVLKVYHEEYPRWVAANS